MAGTGVGLILSILVILSGLIPAIGASAVDELALRAQTSPAPFRVGEVTTPDLTPERFAAALPEEFGGVDREYWGLIPIEDQVHPFSTTSEEFGYVSDTMTVWAVINDLGTEPTVRSAIESVVNGIAADPEFEIEQQSASSAADVPFLLANQGQSLYAFVWGARSGDWVFTVFASSASVREEFVRALADNLRSSNSSQGQASERSSSVSSQPSSAAQSSRQPTDTLISAILNTPFEFSELAPGVYNVEPGERTDGPDPEVTWDGYADINGGVWLRFYADTDLDGSIQYGVFATAADARDAYHVIRDDAELVNWAIDELEDVPGADEDVIAWATYGARLDSGLGLMSGGAITRVANVVVLSTVGSGGGYGDPQPWMADAFSLVATGILHLVPLVSPQELVVTTQASETPAAGTATFPGVAFTPQHLDVQLGDTVSVEVAMPTTDFGGQYNLDILIPPQFQLASLPRCISSAESCVNFEPAIVPQLDGSTSVAISGHYGLGEPGRFALEFDVVDVPQTGGPRVGISAQLAFYTGSIEHDPVDTWLEVSFE